MLRTQAWRWQTEVTPWPHKELHPLFSQGVPRIKTDQRREQAPQVHLAPCPVLLVMGNLRSRERNNLIRPQPVLTGHKQSISFSFVLEFFCWNSIAQSRILKALLFRNSAWFECCVCFLFMGFNQIKMQTSFEIATSKNTYFLNVERPGTPGWLSC